MNIRETYDKSVDALYLRLSDNKVHLTKKSGPGFLVDYDRNNKVVGIEVLDANRRKFCYTIIQRPRKKLRDLEMSAGRSRVNLSVPAYL